MASTPRLAWETAQVAGLLALLLSLVLLLLPLRPRVGLARNLSLRLHERLGSLALLALLLHAGLAIVADPVVLEHLRPTLPWYEACGLAAAALLLILALPASERARNAMWPDQRRFRAWHLFTSCLLLPAIAAHAIGTNRYFHGQGRAAALVAACLFALATLLRARAATRLSASWPFGRTSDMALGSMSRPVALLASLGLLSLLALPWRGVGAALRESPVQRTATLALDFPHERHVGVACVSCHHEFRDHSGPGTCIGCHRSARIDLPRRAEAQFHDFCLGCHREPPGDARSHGPTTGCAPCHHR